MHKGNLASGVFLTLQLLLFAPLQPATKLQTELKQDTVFWYCRKVSASCKQNQKGVRTRWSAIKDT